MVAGADVSVLFGVALWGALGGRAWATSLVLVLALFDIVGEFVAQGTLLITITISFIVATILALLSRRQLLHPG